MSETEAVWFVRSTDGEESGPLTEQEVLARWKDGRLTGATGCRRDGEDDFTPLREVEPFASAIQAEQAADQARPELEQAPDEPADPVQPAPVRRVDPHWVSKGATIAAAVIVIISIVITVLTLPGRSPTGDATDTAQSDDAVPSPNTVVPADEQPVVDPRSEED
ncbi:MAG: DUF4339 domain-containing protein [Phycisphaerales bacterium]|nr:DUF4339 domain-containing protein [Phycisphaerales bacterium]